MAEIITGDNTKGIKSVGELALRISKFDSYRLFTLYENVNEQKLMDVSGNQKYYLVFKSPKKEIRIPEYDPKGFFEVDKENGCILFKITKKNAEDILSMKTAGEKIFHIIRVFEETDKFGKVLNVTDEVEVYHGKWGDSADFNTFTTENKVDLLTKALAAQVDKNAKLFNEYNDLDSKYNAQIQYNSDLESEVDSLKSQLNEKDILLAEYSGNTYDGTILSTDTKYIALESSLENVSFTEEQYKSAMDELLGTNEVNLSEINDESKVNLQLEVNIDEKLRESFTEYYIHIQRNLEYIGDVGYNSDRMYYYEGTFGVKDSDTIKFSFKPYNDKNQPGKNVQVQLRFEPYVTKDKYMPFGDKSVILGNTGDIKLKLPNSVNITAEVFLENVDVDGLIAVGYCNLGKLILDVKPIT